MTTPTTSTGTPIESLRLPARPYNALLRAGIDTVEKLQSLKSLRRMAGISVKGEVEIRSALAEWVPPVQPAGHVVVEPPPPSADEPATNADPGLTDAAEAVFKPPYPPPDDDDPRGSYKMIVNILTHALTTGADLTHEKRAEMERQLKAAKEMIATPVGYYPWSAVHNANPINTLTREEKLHLIRTLPIQIVNKLFPHV